MTTDEILKKVDNLIEKENGIDTSKLTNEEILLQYILPGLENSKNTLSSLYKYSPRPHTGFTGKLKGIVLNKIKNIVLNVVERESMRQQKFNELTYKAIKILIEEKIKKTKNK